jgi:hypothetical protein
MGAFFGFQERLTNTQVLQTLKDKQGIADAKQLQSRVAKYGISVFVLAFLQLVTDAVGSYCAGQTASIISEQSFLGAGGIAFVLQVLSVYFGFNAGVL